MPLISVYFAVSLYVSSKIDAIWCYTYQTKPLFLPFSDLAALEGNSLNETNKPNAHVGDRGVETFVVKCHDDHIDVAMKAYLLDPRLPVDADHVRLGPAGAGRRHCAAKVSANGEYVIRAPLTDCGSKFTQSAVLYDNLLLYSPPASLREVLKEAAVPVRCEYKRRSTVSSRASEPARTPLIHSQSVHFNMGFHLRLMTDDWSGERRSPVYFPGETVNIEASVAHRHLPLRLYADGCAATLTSDVNSYPRYPFIDHQGCFADSQMRFLPRIQDHLVHIRLQPFLFHRDPRRAIYITCSLEAEPITSEEPVRRACYFLSGRWRSADGNDRVCEGCSSRAQSSRKGAARSKTQRRQPGKYRRKRQQTMTLCADADDGHEPNL